jgi:isopenicillin N synthase-like dioxygenase
MLTPNNVFSAAVKDLQNQAGMAVIDLPSITASLHQRSLETARRAMNICQDDNCQRIHAGEDPSHVTGYHPANDTEGLSRYNKYRRGFVFSDGKMFKVTDIPEFEHDINSLFCSLHEIAIRILSELELQWSIPSGWFEEVLGPTKLHSQWHIKSYVPTEEDEKDWLPMHTDPSLVSVLIHDTPGKQNGALGLQYQSPADGSNEREWLDVPYHGHNVATILVGSVLSFMTGGVLKSCQHRVRTVDIEQRVVATLFLRPRASAALVVPPSPSFRGVMLKKKKTYGEWLATVSKNYMKKKANNNHPNVLQKASEGDSSTISFRDEWTEISLLDCDPPLTGREKYLGGERGNNGKIYTIPGHAHRVLVIDPISEPPKIKFIGPTFTGEYKWLRGVLMGNGIIYGIPCHADSVLRIDPETDTVTTISWRDDDPGAPAKNMPWKWHGGNVSKHDGCLYCIPQYAESVLKIDPFTESLSFLTGEASLVGKNKWYGGLCSPIDDGIYGINQNAKGVLRIDPTLQQVTSHGDFQEGGHKWHGGVLGPDGCIYGIPAHADSVLKVVPGLEPKLETIGGPLRTGSHRNDGKYKYLGGAVGRDGNIYFFPSDADYVLQVNPVTNLVREVGPCLKDLEPINNNKVSFTSAPLSIPSKLLTPFKQ